jgi:hypothetical protein
MQDLSMQASAADYALTYFSTPKQQLVARTFVGLTAAKFEPLTLTVQVMLPRPFKTW